jgi:hypothetical protein
VPTDPVTTWLTALDERHLADLTLSEVTRALRALSSCYVERRAKLGTGGALDGAGKRAAFALFYGPQHFLVMRQIAQALAVTEGITRVVDLGCGTGVASAAIALDAPAVALEAYDLNPWAVREANWTYRTFHVNGRASVANISTVRLAGSRQTLILAAYAVNELPADVREALLPRLLDAHARGAAMLVVEPIARRINQWWRPWADAFTAAGGREDEWRFSTPLPARQRALARAAGLSLNELTARSLYLA